MKFFSFTFVVTVLLAAGIWFFWKPPGEMVRLEEAGTLGAEISPPKAIWSASGIPPEMEFPYRPVAYVFFAAALLAVTFKRALFGKPRSLVAYTSVGSGYRISLAVLLWGAFLLLVPFTYRVENNLMGASGLTGAVLFLTGMISFIIYSRSASRLEKRFRNGEKEVLADWVISRNEWLLFLKHNLSKEIKALIIIMTLITAFALLSAHIVSHGEKNGWIAMVATGCIFGLLWMATVFPALWKRRSLLNGNQEVRVYGFGVLIGNTIHLWQQPNCTFGGAVFESEPEARISVHYTSSVLTNGGLVPLKNRIVFPVPRNIKETAIEVARQINQRNRMAAEFPEAESRASSVSPSPEEQMS